MPGGYGAQYTETLGRGTGVIAVPATAVRKVGGVTIDWSTVTAVSSDTTLPDGTVVKAGDKFLRYGTVLVKITASGKYGPAATSEGGATAATDGRQTVGSTRLSEVFILNSNLLFSEVGSEIAGDVLQGGTVYKSRILIGAAGQPTQANLQAACPQLTWAEN